MFDNLKIRAVFRDNRRSLPGLVEGRVIFATLTRDGEPGIAIMYEHRIEMAGEVLMSETDVVKAGPPKNGEVEATISKMISDAHSADWLTDISEDCRDLYQELMTTSEKKRAA